MKRCRPSPEGSCCPGRRASCRPQTSRRSCFDGFKAFWAQTQGVLYVSHMGIVGLGGAARQPIQSPRGLRSAGIKCSHAMREHTSREIVHRTCMMAYHARCVTTVVARGVSCQICNLIVTITRQMFGRLQRRSSTFNRAPAQPRCVASLRRLVVSRVDRHDWLSLLGADGALAASRPYGPVNRVPPSVPMEPVGSLMMSPPSAPAPGALRAASEHIRLSSWADGGHYAWLGTCTRALDDRYLRPLWSRSGWANWSFRSGRACLSFLLPGRYYSSGL